MGWENNGAGFGGEEPTPPGRALQRVLDRDRIVVMFLEFAEDQAKRKKEIFLRSRETRLDDFLRLNERAILPDAGTVSREQADTLAEQDIDSR